MIDFDTTGVGHDDRVVEVAIVRFKGDGTDFDQWSTLVNPGRDLGRARLRGLLSFEDLRHAPRFGDVAGEVVERLRGNVVVAHNLQFERRFLGYEFRRLGVMLPEFPALCTLRLGCPIHARSRALIELCRQYGIPHTNTASALSDAWAAARLLCFYTLALRRVGRASLEALGCTTPQPDAALWPRLPRREVTFDRDTLEVRPDREHPRVVRGVLARAVERLSAETVEEEIEYLDLVDRVVSDRLVSQAESEALRSFASEGGFDGARCERLHASYFDALVQSVWADGVLTQEEQAQIEVVGGLLGISPSAVSTALRGPPHKPAG